MLYFLAAFIIFTLFLLFQRDKRTSVRYLGYTVFFYALAITAMFLYLSKDVRYYYIIQNYFQLPRDTWKVFMFLPIPKNMLIRLMNLFSLLTIYFGCLFSLTYQNKNVANRVALYRRAIGIFLAAEFVFYDPIAEKLLYIFFYPYIMDSAQYRLFQDVTHTITCFANFSLCLGSILNLFQLNRQIYSFPYFKYFAYGETFSYTLIAISHMILFGLIPEHMIRYSKIAGYTSYHSLPLFRNMALYLIFPYYLVFAAILMGASVLALAYISRKINSKDFTISRQIDAADTTSKTFCHYMKNELLALQAEIQLLEVAPEAQTEVGHITQRCQNLYNRLDAIHRSTKTSRLILENTNLEMLLQKMVDRMSSELKDCRVNIRTAGQIPDVMIDPNYFEQAIHNLVTNAIDAMKALPQERRNLTFTLRAIDHWVALSVTDTGPGIASKNLPHIFDPFFSSQPIAEHWGIGLTMTYRIVKAHNGRITVESREGKGTTFRILLPNLAKLTL